MKSKTYPNASHLLFFEIELLPSCKENPRRCCHRTHTTASRRFSISSRDLSPSSTSFSSPLKATTLASTFAFSHFCMESLQSTPMYSQTRIFSKLRPRISLTSISFKTLCTSSVALTQTQNLNPSQTEIPPKHAQKNRSGRRVKAFDAELKKNWLASLSYPFPEDTQSLDEEMVLAHKNEGSEWVIGIDPDVSGALALLKSDGSGCTAQVFDSPSVQILVGKRTRRRLDAKSIVQLVRSFDAPVGTTAYIEQSIVFPQDGKQGWWSGGFGYGLWIGILVASGFSVVPVPSFTWKTKFELSGSKAKKDDSRRVASMLFPSLSSLLKRKKDHGRAEALLIAAYGKAHKDKSDLSFNLILENMES